MKDEVVFQLDAWPKLRSDVLESMKDRRALGLLVIACIMGVVLYYKCGKILPSGLPSLAGGDHCFFG